LSDSVTEATPPTPQTAGEVGGDGATRRSARRSKSADAFRTISEVSEELEVPQHVLRFWETKFAQVRPMKRGGGRRYYRPDDIELLRRIRDLLYRDGYTIKGVQKLLREQKAEATAEATTAAEASTAAPALDAATRNELEALRSDLMAMRRALKDALGR
jgi:DNA-binding transcriptional MerR regulator